MKKKKWWNNTPLKNLIKTSPESLRFVIGRRRRDNFVTVFVHRSSRRSCQLRLFLGLFLNLGDLLSLRGWSTDFHTQNDVSNFRLSKRGNVDAEMKIDFISKQFKKYVKIIIKTTYLFFLP